MLVTDFENAVPKKILMTDGELGRAIDEYLEKRLVKYGQLLPSENIQVEEVFGQTLYIITLESGDDGQ